MQEKEQLLQDVIQKFKKERNSLKSRIIKLETRLNQRDYDESLDVKPVKASGGGAKSVSQLDQRSEADANMDCKSEMARDAGMAGQGKRNEALEVGVQDK